jgi:hypothetical protein
VCSARYMQGVTTIFIDPLGNVQMENWKLPSLLVKSMRGLLLLKKLLTGFLLLFYRVQLFLVNILNTRG